MVFIEDDTDIYVEMVYQLKRAGVRAFQEVAIEPLREEIIGKERAILKEMQDTEKDKVRKVSIFVYDAATGVTGTNGLIYVVTRVFAANRLRGMLLDAVAGNQLLFCINPSGTHPYRNGGFWLAGHDDQLNAVSFSQMCLVWLSPAQLFCSAV